MNAPVRIAILGAGGRGTTYAQWIADHPDRAQVVAIADPRDHYRDAIADRHAIPADKRFHSWQELLAQPGRIADVAVIATPDREHTAPAVALAARGYHLLLEKPIAPTEAECRQVVEAVQKAGVLFAVCHVMRYTPYTATVKRVVDSGQLGEVISLQHLEPVGFWHQAHSFVRGNWRNSTESSFMLLAKSVHDIDWLQYVMGRPIHRVASFGGLAHFTRDNQPAGAADRCLDCAVEPDCAYSAPRIYGRYLAAGATGWPLTVLHPEPTEATIEQALRTGPYGRCVYACDNDVVDHQVVALEFAGQRTATFTMTAFTEHTHRRTRIFGTRGELVGDGETVRVFDFLSHTWHEVPTEIVGDATAGGGHGGGDDALMSAFVTAVATGDPSSIRSGPAESLNSHLAVFAAEQARQTGALVTVE